MRGKETGLLRRQQRKLSVWPDKPFRVVPALRGVILILILILTLCTGRVVISIFDSRVSSTSLIRSYSASPATSLCSILTIFGAENLSFYRFVSQSSHLYSTNVINHPSCTTNITPTETQNYTLTIPLLYRITATTTTTAHNQKRKRQKCSNSTK